MTPPTAPKVYDERQRPLPLGAMLGRGGEAAVFAHAQKPDKAVKLYHRFEAGKAEKLRHMLSHPPADPTRAQGHISLAWPEALAHDGAGNVCGFVMPAVDLRRSRPLHQLANPKARRAQAPGADWRYSLRAARNLCLVVAALHDGGYVLGDLNESNVLVSERALVTLVVCDSAQFRVGRRVFPCPVGRPEFTAPELQGAPIGTRTVQHDRFALAVLVFMLLMEGAHPFGGTPELPDAIRLGQSPYLRGSRLAPAPTAPPLELLSPALRRLLRRALPRSRSRPDARAWQRALEGLERSLATCEANPRHVYGQHLPRCPWCQRRARLGVDAFPAPVGASVTPVRAPTFRGGPLDFAGRYWFGALLLLGSSAVASWGALEGTRTLRSSLPWQPALEAGFAVLAAFLPGLALALLAYRRARSSPAFARGLHLAERLLRAALAAALGTGLFLAALAPASGGALGGNDWLLGSSLWVLAFGALQRVFRRT